MSVPDLGQACNKSDVAIKLLPTCSYLFKLVDNLSDLFKVSRSLPVQQAYRVE